MSDWIEHKAGPCPIEPETKVHVRYLDGTEDDGAPFHPFTAAFYGANFNPGEPDWWKHEEKGCEIVAYRIIEEGK